MKEQPRCKDCIAEEITTIRVLAKKKDGTLEAGPRCVTHHRRVKKERSLKAHGQRVQKVYGISEYEYWAIYEAQGGKCWICRRATGARKRLAVDHNHDTDAVRGLLCGPCNRELIGVYTEADLFRAIVYLRTEPAQELLKEWRSSNETNLG